MFDESLTQKTSNKFAKSFEHCFSHLCYPMSTMNVESESDHDKMEQDAIVLDATEKLQKENETQASDIAPEGII